MAKFTIPRFGDDALSLYVGTYQDGSGNTAVQIVSAFDDQETYATVSINVPGVRLPTGEFVFKTYSENEGLLEQLISAGIIAETGRSIPVGRAGVQPICRIIGPKRREPPQANPASAVPDATQLVRPPNAEELKQLAGYLCRLGYEPEDATGIAAYAYVAVYDRYVTDCPGYVGKVMSVVWSGSPSFFDVFTWEGGQMVRSGREYDQKECDRCGGKTGTLCWNCWRQSRA